MSSFAAALLFLATVALCAPPECIKLQQACVRGSECCEGCCHQGACVRYSEGCAHGICAVHACPDGKECYLQQVQCVGAQCDPIPACKPKHDDHDYDYE